MLSRNSFVATIDAIQEHERIIHEAEKILEPLGVLFPSLDFGKKYHEVIMKLLSETMMDQGEWISWWLYEDVEKIISWEEDGEDVSVDVTDVNALYDFLVSEMKCKDNKDKSFEELKGIIARLEELKDVAYKQYKAEYNDIVANKITDEPRIEALFDNIWTFVDYEEFHDLFWKLINYVETFDRVIGSFYRRLEEVHFEGN